MHAFRLISAQDYKIGLASYKYLSLPLRQYYCCMCLIQNDPLGMQSQMS